MNTEPFTSKAHLTRAEALTHLAPMVGGDDRATKLLDRAQKKGIAQSGAVVVDYNPKYAPGDFAVIWMPAEVQS